MSENRNNVGRTTLRLPDEGLPRERQSSREDATPPATSGATVTVACKMPNGLKLRVFDWIERSIPIMGGGYRMEKQAIPSSSVEPVIINGSAVDLRLLKTGDLNFTLAGGYALTPGVSKDFWDRWLLENKNSSLVKNNIIFAWDTDAGARSKAREQASIKSGMEPIDGERPGERLPGRQSGIRGGVERAERT